MQLSTVTFSSFISVIVPDFLILPFSLIRTSALALGVETSSPYL